MEKKDTLSVNVICHQRQIKMHLKYDKTYIYIYISKMKMNSGNSYETVMKVWIYLGLI